MSTGCGYFQKEKQLIFNMFNFVESEKNGWKIPLYNANERLKAMLRISTHSVERLKSRVVKSKILNSEFCCSKSENNQNFFGKIRNLSERGSFAK